MTTPAPAAATASAMPAPMPRAPPVTRALRPDTSKPLTMDPLVDRRASRCPRREPRSPIILDWPAVVLSNVRTGDLWATFVPLADRQRRRAERVRGRAGGGQATVDPAGRHFERVEHNLDRSPS